MLEMLSPGVLATPVAQLLTMLTCLIGCISIIIMGLYASETLQNSRSRRAVLAVSFTSSLILSVIFCPSDFSAHWGYSIGISLVSFSASFLCVGCAGDAMRAAWGERRGAMQHGTGHGE